MYVSSSWTQFITLVDLRSYCVVTCYRSEYFGIISFPAKRLFMNLAPDTDNNSLSINYSGFHVNAKALLM